MAADPKQAHVAQELPADAGLMACRFHPGGAHVFATAEDRLIYRWELAGGKRAVFKGHDSWIGDVAFVGDQMISAGWDDTLIWWPAIADKLEPAIKVKAHEGWIRSIAVSPDGQLLASGGNDRAVRLWNTKDGAKVRELTGHTRDVYTVMFHPSGQWLLSGDLDGNIRQWEVATGNLVRVFEGKALHTYEGGQQVHYGGIRGMGVSPDKKWLVAGGLHKASNPLGNVQEPLLLRFEWESAKLARSQITEGNPNERVWGLNYHPDGFVVAALGGGKGQLVFWNDTEDKAFHAFNLPTSARGISLHPDGIQVATTHHDAKLRITKLAPKA
jgi:WD40 repeat protein